MKNQTCGRGNTAACPYGNLTRCPLLFSFGHLNFGHLDLFRISSFVLRIYCFDNQNGDRLEVV
jgi:hypothetical protein